MMCRSTNRGMPVLCHECQNLMLDCVYGLLDAPEADKLRAHAAECAACSTALADAGRMQGLFGKAAKLSFDNVHFRTPQSELAQPRRTLARTWLPWAIAAAVLIAVGGIGVTQLGGTDQPKPTGPVD